MSDFRKEPNKNEQVRSTANASAVSATKTPIKIRLNCKEKRQKNTILDN